MMVAARAKRVILQVFFFSWGALYSADMVSEPVVIAAEKKALQATDEKGRVTLQRPMLFSVLLGNRFTLANPTALADSESFARQNVLRPDEVIYKGSTAAAFENGPSVGFEPALRLEWEVPFELQPILPAWRSFSTVISLEAGFTSARNLLTATGSFNYKNTQANDAALTDVTYNGGLTISEKRQNLNLIMGVGTELTNATMMRLKELKVLFRLGVGVSLQSGQRNYSLDLQPQYISAVGSPQYSDTYVIKSSITQSYATAVLPAGRAELGFRMRLTPRLHFAILGSFTVVYGVLPYDTIGSFYEQAGANKITYQKVISGINDQDSLGLMPAAFLALSLEI